MKYFLLFILCSLISGCALLFPEAEKGTGARVTEQLANERERGYTPESEVEKYWVGKNTQKLREIYGEPTRKIGAAGQGEIYEYDLSVAIGVNSPEKTGSAAAFAQNNPSYQPHWSRASTAPQRTFQEQDGIRVARHRFFTNKEGIIIRVKTEKIMRQ